MTVWLIKCGISNNNNKQLFRKQLWRELFLWNLRLLSFIVAFMFPQRRSGCSSVSQYEKEGGTLKVQEWILQCFKNSWQLLLMVSYSFLKYCLMHKYPNGDWLHKKLAYTLLLSHKYIEKDKFWQNKMLFTNFTLTSKQLNERDLKWLLKRKNTSYADSMFCWGTTLKNPQTARMRKKFPCRIPNMILHGLVSDCSSFIRKTWKASMYAQHMEVFSLNQALLCTSTWHARSWGRQEAHSSPPTPQHTPQKIYKY